MKFLAAILSIYIFALSLAPCEDNALNNDEVKTEISHSTGDDHPDSDLCSPFCQCHCCHIHVLNFEISDFSLILSEIPTDIFFHNSGVEKDFNTSILQPPQV